MPVENSFKCIFAVACDCLTVKNHTKSHENHTKFIGGTKLLKKPAPFTGADSIYEYFKKTPVSYEYADYINGVII